MTRLSDAAAQAARTTGLPKVTCMTLLEEGWTLVAEMGKPTRWDEPAVRYGTAEDRQAAGLVA